MASGSEHLSRRGFLSVAVGAAGTEILRRVCKADETESTAKNTSTSTRNAILVMLTGGMSQLDSLTYKPDAPSAIRGPFYPVQTNTGQSIFSSQFPHLASIDDRFALLGAMQATNAGSHDGAYRNWLNAANGRHLAEQLKPQDGSIHYMDLVTPGVLPLMQPERVELQLNSAISMEWNEQRKRCDCSTPLTLLSDLSPRMQLLNGLENAAHAPLTGAAAEIYAEQRRNAYYLVQNGLLSVLSESEDPRRAAREKKEYGDHPYGEIFRLAGRLADPEQGIAKFVLIETGDWDHHWDLLQRFDMRAPQMDQALTALIEQYGDRVVIAMRGEFGRSMQPQLSSGHLPGRSHFPLHAGIIAGPTINAGLVYGKTSKDGSKVVDAPMSDAAFAYTLLEATGDLSATSRGRGIPALLRS